MKHCSPHKTFACFDDWIISAYLHSHSCHVFSINPVAKIQFLFWIPGLGQACKRVPSHKDSTKFKKGPGCRETSVDSYLKEDRWMKAYHKLALGSDKRLDLLCPQSLEAAIMGGFSLLGLSLSLWILSWASNWSPCPHPWQQPLGYWTIASEYPPSTLKSEIRLPLQLGCLT